MKSGQTKRTDGPARDEVIEFRSNTDNLPLTAYRWSASRPAEAVVVISHGSAEHSLRYRRFASALAEHGFETWALDHRGHGRSPGPKGLADAGEGGWDGLVEDLAQLVDMARAANEDLPLALFSHSMGAFAGQDLCTRYSNRIDAVVFSGTTAFDIPEGLEELPPFLPNVLFEPARTPYDWLSRDEAEVDKYVADPLCGFESDSLVCKARDLRRLSDPHNLASIRNDLPVLIVAGEADPLNRGLYGVRRLEEKLREAGVKRIALHCYPGGRHEMLNEINRDEVTNDIIAWLKEALSSAVVRYSYIRKTGDEEKEKSRAK